MHLVGFPSKRDMMDMVRGRLIHNCLKNMKDIVLANKLYPPSKKNPQGGKPELAKTEYVAVPRCIRDLNWDATLVMDVKYVNGLAFMPKETTVYYPGVCARRRDKTLSEAIQNVVNFYTTYGFKISTVLADPECSSLEAK